MPLVANLATESQGDCCQHGSRHTQAGLATLADMATAMENIADRIKTSGLSDAEIADKLGCNRTTVYRWRKGARFPDQYLARLAELLKTNESEILLPIGRPSLDHIVKDLPEETVRRIAKRVEVLASEPAEGLPRWQQRA